MNKIKEHEALLIFLLSALGYLCTYFFQWGKFYYYSIPRSFIEINSNTIVSSLAFIIVLLIFSLFYVGFIKKNANLIKTKNFLISKALSHDLLTQFIIVFLVFTFLEISYFSDSKPYYYLIIAFLFMLYFLLKNYESLFILSYISFILLLVFFIGYIVSEKESSYLILYDDATQNSYAVLHSYDGKAIIAEMNLKKKLIYTNYQLIKFESDKINEYELHLKQIKDIKVQKIK